MFRNVGGKIKVVAVNIFALGTMLSLYLGILIIRYGGGGFYSFYITAAGVLIIAFGTLYSLVSAWFIYGFGQLVENSDRTRACAVENGKLMHKAILLHNEALHRKGTLTDEEYSSIKKEIQNMHKR